MHGLTEIESERSAGAFRARDDSGDEVAACTNASA